LGKLLHSCGGRRARPCWLGSGEEASQRGEAGKGRWEKRREPGLVWLPLGFLAHTSGAHTN